MFANVKDLPDSLQKALTRVNYTRKDIDIRVKEKTTSQVCVGDGQRGAFLALDLAVGECRETWGSWGGSNMFVSTVVDDNQKEYVIPPNVCVIKAHTGGNQPTYAYIECSATTIAPMLPQGATLTDRECKVLYAFKGISGGAYRKEYLSRHKVTDTEISDLEVKGMIKSVGRGKGITTEGKNVLELTKGRFYQES